MSKKDLNSKKLYAMNQQQIKLISYNDVINYFTNSESQNVQKMVFDKIINVYQKNYYSSFNYILNRYNVENCLGKNNDIGLGILHAHPCWNNFNPSGLLTILINVSSFNRFMKSLIYYTI